MQQRIFMFMPLIFIAFCYNFASALALYWTVQNLFSVVQLYATRKQSTMLNKRFDRLENTCAQAGLMCATGDRRDQIHIRFAHHIAIFSPCYYPCSAFTFRV